LLLHLVDLKPFDESDPEANFAAIEQEVAKFAESSEPGLADKPRWLVLNKMDLFADQQEQEQACQAFVEAVGWQGPVFAISAATGKGTEELVWAIMEHVEQKRAVAINPELEQEELPVIEPPPFMSADEWEDNQ
jgi:GTP-binding protein